MQHLKERLDIYLTENGYAESREKAKSIIMGGIVYINNQKATKAGDMVNDGDTVEVRGNTLKYVSRGGLKLEKAMTNFDLTLEGKVCMDVGASTGGFTDCMLQNGASKVYCVDVGYGQLAWKLRQDERVRNMERTNIRYVTEADIDEKLDFASIDVAFISLKLVLPVVYNLLTDEGEVVALIKPQFEAGREKVGKKGVVRDKNVHIEVIENVLEFTRSFGFKVSEVTYSPIKGPEGNIEYLMHISKQGADNEIDVIDIVENSHTL